MCKGDQITVVMVVCEALCVHCTVRTQYRSSVVGTKPNKPLILISIHNVYFAIEQDSFFAGKFLLSNDSHTICQQLFFLLRIIFLLFFRLDNIEFKITFHRITD